MIIALLLLDLRMEAHSLKEKRSLVKSVLNKLSRRHNLSVFEASYQDIHNRTLLAAVWVGADRDCPGRILENAIGLAESAGAELVSSSLEFL